MGFLKKKIWKRTIETAVMALMILLFTACGNSNEPEQVQKEFVYVPEYVELPPEGQYYNSQVIGDYLYYNEYAYDEQTGESSESFCKLSIKDGTVTKLPLDTGENGGINQYTVGEDGSIYTMVYKWSMDENDPMGGRSSQEICKFDSNGEVVYRTCIDELIDENGYIGAMAVDAEGRAYLTSEGFVLLFDSEGKSAGKVSIGGAMNSWINCAGKGKDGKVYVCCSSGNGGNQLIEIDFDKKATGSNYDNFPNGNSSGLYPGLEKDFLVSDGNTVYEYDLKTQTKEAVFDWLDSDINGQYVNALGVTTEGKMVAIINDWSNGANEVAVLEKKKSSEVPQRETIVFASLYNDSDLQAAAVTFNKSNDKYRISIKTYYDYNNGGENAWNDAITNFNNDLTSGNCPDIVALSNMDINQLVSKEVLEDLNDYLDKSTVLSREEFIPNVLDGYTIDDVLVGIPKYFNIQTVVGSAKDLGSDMGWSIDDMIAYADEHPKANLFDYASKSSVMYYCMMYNENYFVDWSNGKCNFNSPEFISLLEFVNRFPEEPEYDDMASTPSKIQNGEVLLDNAYIYDLQEVQMYEEMFSGDFVFIGYPTTDGSVGCAFTTNDLYGITTKSKHKEGAWEFIESYLAREDTDRWSHNGFPSIKKQLDAMVERETKVETYTWVDENGVEHEETSSGGGSVTYEDGWTYNYRTPTMEEAKRVLELIDIAKPAASSDNEIMKIIAEEADAFFKGGKSATETAEIIQRRVQIYVDENS